MDLDVHLLDGSHAVATLGPVVMRVIVSAPTRRSDLDIVRARLDAVLEHSPAAGAWIVAHHGAPLPGLDVRRHVGPVFGPLGDRVVISYALLGLGFWASAATAATTMLIKLMGMRVLIETTLEGSAKQLCMELIGIDPAQLIAAHDQLYERIKAAANEDPGSLSQD